MMVRMVTPEPGERLCDPAAGTFGFIVAANDYLKNRPMIISTCPMKSSNSSGMKLFPAWSWSRPLIAWPL